MITHLTNHVADARLKMWQQYKEIASQEGIIDAFVGFQTQDQEDLFWALIEETYIATAVGAQLDRIGEIVIQDRNGLSDEIYRVLIYAKIGANVSKGDPESIINVARLLTQSTLVHFQEYWPAGWGMAVNGPPMSQDIINKVYSRLDKVDPGGVRFEALVCFAEDDAFSFAGTTEGLGFGDLTDLGVGGEFAQICMPTLPAFGFSGPLDSEETAGGFGTLLDPFFGGVFQ